MADRELIAEIWLQCEKVGDFMKKGTPRAISQQFRSVHWFSATCRVCHRDCPVIYKPFKLFQKLGETLALSRVSIFPRVRWMKREICLPFRLAARSFFYISLTADFAAPPFFYIFCSLHFFILFFVFFSSYCRLSSSAVFISRFFSPGLFAPFSCARASCWSFNFSPLPYSFGRRRLWFSSRFRPKSDSVSTADAWQLFWRSRVEDFYSQRLFRLFHASFLPPLEPYTNFYILNKIPSSHFLILYPMKKKFLNL